jgi:hypothetical protein
MHFPSYLNAVNVKTQKEIVGIRLSKEQIPLYLADSVSIISSTVYRVPIMY